MQKAMTDSVRYGKSIGTIWSQTNKQKVLLILLIIKLSTNYLKKNKKVLLILKWSSEEFSLI